MHSIDPAPRSNENNNMYRYSLYILTYCTLDTTYTLRCTELLATNINIYIVIS